MPPAELKGQEHLHELGRGVGLGTSLLRHLLKVVGALPVLDAGHADDSALRLFQQIQEQFGQQEGTEVVGLEESLQAVLGCTFLGDEVAAASVVDQHIQSVKLRIEGGDKLLHSLHLARIQVQVGHLRARHRISSVLHSRLCLCLRAARVHHVKALASQVACCLLANAGAGACDDGDLHRPGTRLGARVLRARGGHGLRAAPLRRSGPKA
mmetsp:Transcript_706/g.2193  ORF Transcript_706/g.2193 Transcript_706/m.2193 type:complete len:210 (+) Transcript_706:370-999(+)